MGVNQWLKLITQKIREKKRKHTDSMKPRLAKEANSVAGLDKGPRFHKHDRQPGQAPPISDVAPVPRPTDPWASGCLLPGHRSAECGNLTAQPRLLGLEASAFPPRSKALPSGLIRQTS